MSKLTSKAYQYKEKADRLHRDLKKCLNFINEFIEADVFKCGQLKSDALILQEEIKERLTLEQEK